MIQILQCMLGKHKVDRHRVREHQGDFFGPCSGCGRRLFRESGGWRVAAPGDSMRSGDPPGEGKRTGHD
jgi:hypothetical protein